ncbi:MAG: hypothetical protein HZB39_02865 [Planctomycetes bacterium]|nr:hypothetical protein [Planctomycetota bacterium]
MPCAPALALLLAMPSLQEPRDLGVSLRGAVPARGEFAVAGDDLVLRTSDRYDCVAWTGAIDALRYTLELELTHDDGLCGGGLVFGALAGEQGPDFGQMIRFDGQGELLHGAFARGQFESVGRIVLTDAIALGRRARLVIEVDAEARTMDVAVDGTRVAAGLPLRSTSGRVGVQGSLGRVRFHALRALGAIGEARLAWPVAFAPRTDGFVVATASGKRLLLPRDGGPARAAVDLDATPLASALTLDGASVVGGIVELPGGRRFAAQGRGAFDAIALARDVDGALVVLDRLSARVLGVDPSGDDSGATLRFPTRTSVGIAPPRAAYVADERGAFIGASDERGVIEGLVPSTRYVLHAAPASRSWPADARFVGIAFTSPPPAGVLRVRRLHLVVGVFCNVASEPGDLAALPAATDYDRARIENEVRACVAWYFHHSGHRLWLEPHFVHRAERTTTQALADDGRTNGTPPRALLESLAADAKLPLADVAGFCVVIDAKARAGEDRPWRRIGGGGGLTLGAHGTGYGISWFFVPETPGMVGWLACHELHHQIDALFEISGMPEYPFNHFAPSLRNVAFFGEHWDGNAWILRTWPAHRWDALRFGDDVLVADEDGDGLPDGDARLPFDEDRFGSDPKRADTDGDGLDDRDDARLGARLVDSGFESMLAPLLEPDPRRADADGDGIPDPDDPFPLLPFTPVLREGERLALRTVDDPRLAASLAVALSDGALEVRTASADAGSIDVQVMLDLGADGWFSGADNLRIRARGDSARVVEVFDAGSHTEWPRGAPERAAAFPVSARVAGGVHVLRIAFGTPLGAGAKFGLSIAYRGALADPADPRWLTVFPPHALVPFAVHERDGR